MSSIGYGPPTRVDGPLPVEPRYGLLQAARQPAAGVRFVADGDAAGIERWINGADVWPYQPGPPLAWDACSNASPASVKDDGVPPDIQKFASITLYLPVTCSVHRVLDTDAYRRRAEVAFAAVESAGVAAEVWNGTAISAQPHFADGTGTFPNGDTATSPVNALALLENEIAAVGALGLIHMSPAMATVLGGAHVVQGDGGVLRTINGNVVIPDAGYAGGASPAGHAAATGTQEWIFATGAIDVRRSDVTVVPDRVSEAVDRGTGGASGAGANSVTYRVERFYLVAWDGIVHAAVRADRCQVTC